jgi:hypothetical protein
MVLGEIPRHTATQRVHETPALGPKRKDRPPDPWGQAGGSLVWGWGQRSTHRMMIDRSSMRPTLVVIVFVTV